MNDGLSSIYGGREKTSAKKSEFTSEIGGFAGPRSQISGMR
jgi:hypothetical protein